MAVECCESPRAPLENLDKTLVCRRGPLDGGPYREGRGAVKADPDPIDRDLPLRMVQLAGSAA